MEVHQGHRRLRFYNNQSIKTKKPVQVVSAWQFAPDTHEGERTCENEDILQQETDIGIAGNYEEVGEP